MRVRRLAGPVLLILVCLLLSFAGVAEAQKGKNVPGGIQGQVVAECRPDASGALVYIPGRSFVAITGPDGAFELSSVPPGTYTLHVEMPNVGQAVEQQVTVAGGQLTQVGAVALCQCTDADGDGFSPDGGNCGLVDCNDNDASINPAAPEACDGVDNNCNTLVDEGCQVCTDADGDGFYGQPGCGSPLDCNDTDPAIRPGAPELCDGKDNDCDGMVDEGCPVSCADGVKNGDETDVDCGGSSCPRCGDGDSCGVDSDCASLVCGPSGVCLPPSCTDGVQNGSETDVDCGGPVCPAC